MLTHADTVAHTMPTHPQVGTTLSQPYLKGQGLFHLRSRPNPDTAYLATGLASGERVRVISIVGDFALIRSRRFKYSCILYNK